MIRPFLLPIICLFLHSQEVKSQVRWTIDFNLGLPANIPTPLSISQSGYPDINLMAVYVTEPFIRPFNWMWRIGRWNSAYAWEFETIHHKMILKNRPDEVQWFSITHGFNTLTINRAIEMKEIIVRVGVGGVLTHPESTIRHQVLNEKSGLLNLGYYLRGPVFMTSAARPVAFGKSFLINFEGKITAGYAQVPIADGHARVIHLALHLQAGPGGSVKGRKRIP